jgi:hypothetical protein
MSAQLGRTLEAMAVRGTDLRAGYSIKLMTDGDQVAGQVTLDNCGYDFTTESHRVARRQYDIYAGGAGTGLSNELVAYDSAAAAAKAISQWHTAAAHCPHKAVQSTVAGIPPMVEKISHNELNAADLPVRHNAATTMSATIKGHGTFYNVSILQVEGRFLDSIYLTSDRPITASESATAAAFAVITGRRLAALG